MNSKFIGAPKKYSLGKAQKLVSKIAIQRVFKSGQSIFKYPLLLKYTIDENLLEDTVKILILASASSKKIKSAVQRNLAKRRTKEAYRLISPTIYQSLTIKNKTISLGFVYIATEICEYPEIESSVSFLLDEFKSKLEV